MNQVHELARKKSIWWAPGEDEILENLSKFQWACDSCLQSKRAIPANPAKQLFCDYPPYLSYFDKERTCETCGESFVFSASEQKFWYENLGFWVQSEAINCKSCRKKARENKQQK
jgi:hypothetical protein